MNGHEDQRYVPEENEAHEKAKRLLEQQAMPKRQVGLANLKRLREEICQEVDQKLKKTA